MSVLDTPRVYFRGQMTWDPIVTNNSDSFYDLDTGKPVLGAGTAADYRERARQELLVNGEGSNWNPHGTHRSSFVETVVTGVDAGQGLRTDDALVGVPLSFVGKLVDLDPYGATTSQLFFDELSCGIQGGSQVLLTRRWPMVARRINFARNDTYTYVAGVASVIWQASFPAGGGGVSVFPRGSAILGLFEEQLAGAGIAGLTVRINAYRTVYYGKEAPVPADGVDLADRIAAGGFHPNPARSHIVGVIGLWRAGEMPSVPGDRVLTRAQGSPVNTAFAKVGDGRLVVDLSNSVPETGFDLAKRKLGPLTVVAATPGGPVALGTLGEADYDKAAYEATSGIVTLPVDEAQAAAAAGADLQVRTGAGAVLLRERPLTVVADPPNTYLEQGEQPVTVSLRAFLWGRRPGAPVSVALVEVGGPTAPAVVQTDDDGQASFPLRADKAGAWTWVLVPFQGQPPPFPTRPADPFDYVTLRVTPADDAIAAMEPTWDNVHTFVLRDWEALAPCMDNWLPLGDEQQVKAAARLVRRLTSRDSFDNYHYMPVTRDLSRGQRTLLHRWCDAVLGVSPAPEPALTADAEVAVERNPFGRGF